MIPVAMGNGISKGYLRPADGLVESGEGPGLSRGGINWNGLCYRVMGTKLVSIDASNLVTELGDVGGAGQASLDYSFDLLAVVSDGRLFYWDGTTFSENTSPNLGTPLCVVFVDGYFMMTDGEFLYVTELNDPYTIDILKYGTSEVDPDPVVGLRKLKDEIYAINRYTIEVFNNIGGTGFPFQRNPGAQIQKGAVGTFANAVFLETIAFLGSGRGEAPGVYLGMNSQVNKISTREIDQVLATYTEDALSHTVMEPKVYGNQSHLWVRLLDRTLVYDAAASAEAGSPVWFILTSGLAGFEAYRAKDLVWCYDKYLVGDTSTPSFGYLTETLSSQWGDPCRWEFSTSIVYNESHGALFHELELVSLTGRVALGTEPQIATSYSIDGETWSQDAFLTVGTIGERLKRLAWRRQGKMRNWRIQRFQGDSDAFISVARLEARMEPLAV